LNFRSSSNGRPVSVAVRRVVRPSTTWPSHGRACSPPCLCARQKDVEPSPSVFLPRSLALVVPVRSLPLAMAEASSSSRPHRVPRLRAASARAVHPAPSPPSREPSAPFPHLPRPPEQSTVGAAAIIVACCSGHATTGHHGPNRGH
jgi:hypothetical protein